MSKQALEQVVRKASSDAAFRAKLAKDFDVAVKPYKLTAAEKKQLRPGTAAQATEHVPERQAAQRQAARLQTRALARSESRIESKRLAARSEMRAVGRLNEA